MIYTFEIDLLNKKKLEDKIQKYCEYKGLYIKHNDLNAIITFAQQSAIKEINVTAKNEDVAWERLDLDNELYDDIQITNVSCEDEYEAEQRAKDKYTEYLIDKERDER